MTKFKDLSGKTPTPFGNNPGIGGLHMMTQQQESDGDYIEEKLTNLNEKIKTDFTKFRDKEIEKLVSALISKKKSNALLIGDAGVGKTQIVESLAYKIQNNDPLIPNSLNGYTIYELPIVNLIAGNGVVGSLEEDIKEVIDFAKNEKVILFIDEIHQILNKNDSVNNKIAQILKPELARGEIKVIAATTTQESRAIENDPAFKRRFQKILINELSKNQTLDVLKLVRNNMMSFYENKIIITDKDLSWFVDYSEKYKDGNSHRPDSALTLMDRTCANAIVKRQKILKETTDPQVLSILNQNPNILLGEEKIKQTAKLMISSEAKDKNINEDEFLKEFSHIKGQDEIINKLIKKISKEKLNLFPTNKPLSFLFAGKSGIGKTEIAKIIAKYLLDETPIKLNMAEYSNEMSLTKLIGSSAGFIGYADNKEGIFDKLKSNPYQVVILDEFDKAAPNIQKLFMNVLDEGFMDTNDNGRIDFSKAIIIATNNHGFTETTKTKTIGFNTGSVSQKEKVVNNLKTLYPIELLNRFTEIYEFNSISKEIYEDILKDIYETEIKRIKNIHSNIKLNDTLDEKILKDLSDKTYSKDFNARPAFKTIKEYIEENI